MFLYFRKKRSVVAIAEAFGSDPYWANVVLLSHLDKYPCIDETNKSVISGSAGIASTQSKFAGYATFNGTSNYLSIPYSSDTSIAGGADFTIEFWFKTSIVSGTYMLMHQGIGLQIYVENNLIRFALSSNNSSTYFLHPTNCGSIGQNSWNHFALVKNGTTYSSFLNGSRTTSSTNVGQLSAGTGPLYIGSYQNTSLFFSGGMDEVRITKGIARYTSNFSVATSAFPAGLELDYDWFWDKTVFQMKGGNNGAVDNTWLDNSSNVHAITKYNAALTQSNSLSPFPNLSPSLVFDSTTGALLPNGSGAIGTGQFCLEFWVNPNRFTSSGAYGSSATQLINTWYWMTGAVSGWALRSDSSGLLTLMVSNGTYNTQFIVFTAPTPMTVSVWNHVALTRDSSNTLRCFINGAMVWSGTYAASLNLNYNAPNAYSLRIGHFIADGTYYQGLDGKMSNIRIVTGQPVYTANFSVPTSPLTAIAGTQVLVANAVSVIKDNATFVDSSSNAMAVTRNGSVSQGSVSPFSTGGSSAYFDSTGPDYLSVPNSSSLNLAAADFTIETWINFSSTANGQQPISGYSGSGVNWCLYTASSSLGLYLSSNGTSWDLASHVVLIPAITTKVWYHVAVVRSGSSIKAYVNGTLVNTVSVSTTAIFTNNQRVYVGGIPAGYIFNGYLSNTRIVKGTAVYTANFSVPTAPLTAIANTSLLLKYAVGSIVDASGNSNIVTVGNITNSVSTKKTGIASVYYGGAGSYTTFANKSDYAFGTGAFTIEFWINAAAQSDSFLFGGRSAFGTMYINTGSSGTSSTPGSLRYVGSSTITSGTKVITDGSWHHCAITRDGANTVKLFVDGALVGSGTDTTNYTITTGKFILGANDNPGSLGTNSLTGYIDDFRITKGITRYSATFAPKSSEVASRSPVGSELLPTTYDQYWQQVMLSMSGDTLTDAKSHVFSINGDAAISTLKKYGSGSIQLGTTGFLSTPYVKADFDWWTSDFTVEMFIYANAFSDTGGGNHKATQIGNFSTTGPEDYWSFGTIANGTVQFFYFNGAVNYINGSTQLATGAWHHIAMTKSGNTIRLFANGALEATATLSGTPQSGTEHGLVIGRQFNVSFNGHIDDLRITKGLARYTAAYTVPAIANPISGAAF